jgi:microcystin-dependent protein
VSDPFLGEIRAFGFSFAPRGWAMCNGQLMAISQNEALFALIGTFYGGNGTSTFGLPDLQGRVPLSMGQGTGLSSYQIGERAGTETVTLTTGQVPSHIHSIAQPVNNGDGAQSRPAGHVPGRNGAYSATDDGSSTLTPFNTAPIGGSQPHENVQPFLVVNFCIALQGTFPSRN